MNCDLLYTMRIVNQIYFFVPGISQKYQSGGLNVAKQVRSFFSEIVPQALCEMVTTHEKINGALYAPELFAAQKILTASNSDDSTKNTLCVVTWGPLVENHISMIRKNLPHAKILFYAQSFGWGIKVPAGIPIVCVSRFVMSQWALYSKGNFVGYVPPALSENFSHTAVQAPINEPPRTIDVLVHTRKQNSYCLNELLPALKKTGLAIHAIDEWIDQDQFANLLAQSKIFLYCTALHKAGFFRRLPGEGFGLPPLEALAKGCTVASNLLGGVSDFLTPGVNCIKVETGSVEKDVNSITRGVQNFQAVYDKQLLEQYSAEGVKNTWLIILKSIF